MALASVTHKQDAACWGLLALGPSRGHRNAMTLSGFHQVLWGTRPAQRQREQEGDPSPEGRSNKGALGRAGRWRALFEDNPLHIPCAQGKQAALKPTSTRHVRNGQVCREGQQTCGGPGLGEGRRVAATSRGRFLLG